MIVYICHPYSADPEGNTAKVRAIAQRLKDAGHMPWAPHLYLPQLYDEATEREAAMDFCLEMVSRCDVLLMPNEDVQATAGVVAEVAVAGAEGVPRLTLDQLLGEARR